MAPIPVPKPPKKAYNPRRRPGTLLQSQLTHLEWAIRPAGERQPKAFRVKPAKTEAEAADRIETLTEELHRQATSPKETMPPPAARPARAKSKSRSRTPSRRGKSR